MSTSSAKGRISREYLSNEFVVYLGRRPARSIRLVNAGRLCNLGKESVCDFRKDFSPKQNAYPSISVEPYIIMTCRAAATS